MTGIDSCALQYLSSKGKQHTVPGIMQLSKHMTGEPPSIQESQKQTLHTSNPSMQDGTYTKYINICKKNVQRFNKIPIFMGH
jgi:hypothetical protein